MIVINIIKCTIRNIGLILPIIGLILAFVGVFTGSILGFIGTMIFVISIMIFADWSRTGPSGFDPMGKRNEE